MKTIHLAALDLDLKVPDTIHYYDDGFVESIEGKTTFLDWKYKNKFELEEKSKTLIGRKNLYYSRGQWHIHIFYLHDKYPENETNTRGHEETHALRTIDLITSSGESSTGYATQEFQIATLKRKEIGFNIAKIEKEFQDRIFKEEVIASIGGLFAVHQKHNCLLKPKKMNSEDYHTIAYQIYQQAVQDSLKLTNRANKKSLWQKLFS